MIEKNNTGHLCSIYCPACQKVTDKISFNLLREAGKVTVYCSQCQRATFLEYNGKSVIIFHQDDNFSRIYEEMSVEQRKDFKKFVSSNKNI